MKKRIKATFKIASEKFTVVAIGASAGRIEACSLLLKNIAPDTGMAFVIVSHLLPTRKSYLAYLLGKITPLPVVEAKSGLTIEPNHVYVIPPNTQMSLRNRKFKLRPRNPDERPAMPINYFFKSLAATEKGRAISVVLSGRLFDGAEGTKAIKAYGGITFAQKPASTRESSMPRNAIATNKVDFVLTPQEIGRRLSEHTFTLPLHRRSAQFLRD